MRCSACGKTIEDDVSFCAYCGATVQVPSERHAPNRVLSIGALVLVLLVAAGIGLAIITSGSAGTATPLISEAFATAPPPPSAAPTSPAVEPSPKAFGSANSVPAQPRPTATPIVIVVTATWTPSPTPTPTFTPSPTPTRMFFPLRLSTPLNGEVFKDELVAPFLEWKAATDGPLMPDEWYRIQVYHSFDQLQCNLYTKRTFYQLPASGRPDCDPLTWRFNTGDYIWRVSFVTKTENDVHHDVEITNSEGRLFKWNK